MSSKNIRIVILVIIDFCIVGFSSLMALALRFDIFYVPDDYLLRAFNCFIFDALIAICILAMFKLYNRVWAYASIEEIVASLKATVIIEIIYMAYHIMFNISMPRSYYIYDWIMLFVLISASRFSIRIINQIRKEHKNINGKCKIMIIGAGSAASLLIKEIRDAMDNSRVVCIIDDNPNKRGKYIHSIPIVGNRNAIEKNVKKYDIDEIIIAIPSASPKEIKNIINVCNNTNAKLKILPSISVSLTESLSKSLREVNYEDLLGRDSVVIQNKELKNFVLDKTVMVTGGGGTIGSELCRQIVSNSVKRLLIIDIYENGAYELQMELKHNFPEVDVIVLIASVRDYGRLEVIFNKYRPDVIYHAAAHKHVPLMEVSPHEAVKNNCKGTLNLVKLADKYSVKKFVLISTDKAVKPTNVMGATKRICEMIVQAFANKSKTEFVAVRFGNVLGSNGSVIPLFLKQIEAGGPVTVTHREITRFFMTISEAASLVLKAGLLAKGGEIFVLDMGEPVKIYELAKNLIKMKGLLPNEDISIEIIGLRPGEKLYEELLMEEEGLKSTSNNLIFVGNPIDIDITQFFKKLDDLIFLAESNAEGIKEAIRLVCDTYKITENK